MVTVMDMGTAMDMDMDMDRKDPGKKGKRNNG